MKTTITSVVPSAVATDEDIAAWQTLPRDEQLRRLRHELHHPDCDRICNATMDKIGQEGRALAAKLRDRLTKGARTP